MEPLVRLPIHLPGHRRREEERALRARVELQIAQADLAEQIRAEILAEREAGAPARVTVQRAALTAVWRNRGFLAPFALLAVLAACGWASFWVLLVWAAVSGWWWVDGHMPVDWAPPAVDEGPAPLPVPDTIPHRWEANVGAEGRFLAGAEIDEVRVLPHATRYSVQLVPGKQTVEGVGDSLGLVSSGIRTPLAKIVWEPDPEHAEEDSTRGRLTVVHHNVKDEIRYFRHPLVRDGVVFVGDHIDFDGQAGWTVYEDNSIRGGLIAGTTDYGKSRLLDVLAASIMSPEFQEQWPTHILYVDGKGGASSPLLAKHATLTVGPDEADEAVRAFLRMGDARQSWNIANDVQGFNPGVSPRDGVEGLPGWLAIVDESHIIWPQPKVEPWTRCARERRQLGQAVISSGHVTSLDGFGDDDALRSSLLRGNAVTFRIESTMAGSRIPGLPIAPHQLPKIRGYFQMVPGEESGRRAAPARGWYSPTEKEKAKAAACGKPMPDDVPTLEEQFARAVRPPVCDMDAKALGIVYSQREERAAAKKERARAVAEGRELPAERQRIAVVRALPASTPAAEPEVTEEQALTTAKVILDYLRPRPDGAKRADIIKHVNGELGTSESAVTKALNTLSGKKVVARVGDGRWQLVAQPQEGAV